MATVDKSRITKDKEGRYYIAVIYGDTLSEIAEAHFGDHKRYPELAALNRLEDANKIYVGQTIYLPDLTAGTTPSVPEPKKYDTQVTVTQFGLLSTRTGSQDEIGVAWLWSQESQTEKYDIEWRAYKGGIYDYTDSESLRRYSTFSVPDDTPYTKIQFRVRPVPKKIKDKDGAERDAFSPNLWTKWSENTYDVIHRPPIPSSVDIELKDLTLTAKVTNIAEDGVDEDNNVVYKASLIEFQIVPDNSLAQATSGKAAVVAGDAAHTFTVEAGHVYKVRARSHKSSNYSEWSEYSTPVETSPSTPTLSDPVAKSSKSIYVEWSESKTATGYKLAYTDDPEGFYEGANISEVSAEGTNYTVNGLTSGLTYSFRVKAVKDSEESAWSEVKTTVIGTNPTSPTTWSSTTTAIAGEGETVSLYWVHNATDGSAQASAEVTVLFKEIDNFELVSKDVRVELGKIDWDKSSFNAETNTATYHIIAAASDTQENRTHSLIIDTHNYTDGAILEWNVITTGTTGKTSDASADRTIEVYSKPVVTITVTNPAGTTAGTSYYIVDYFENTDTYTKTSDTIDPPNGTLVADKFTVTGEQVRSATVNDESIFYCVVEEEDLASFPFITNVKVIAKTRIQRPIEYQLLIIATEPYDTVDNLGNPKRVSAMETLYSKHYVAPTEDLDAQLSTEFSTDISAKDVTLDNGQTYILKCVVAMSSGIISEASVELPVSWTSTPYHLSAQIGVDRDDCSVYMMPYCAIVNRSYYQVSKVGSVYYMTSTKFDYVYRDPNNTFTATTSTGEQAYQGTTATGTEVYYTIKEESTPITDVLLSVYRREYDGTFTEIITDLDGANESSVTDPHPSLDYARYRIIATDKKTSTVSFTDIPNYPIGEKAIIIQWNEPYSTFAVSENSLSSGTGNKSFLRLPYNIDVTNSRDPDVSLIKYIGRKHPVSYYGTQVGEKASWSTVVPKDDTETIYALQRLQAWSGDVYVREPYGTGYWANIKVSLSKTHLDPAVPVTLEIVRVEGGA